MPGRNRKGPFGEGPMTGRGLGRCGSQRRTTNEPNAIFSAPENIAPEDEQEFNMANQDSGMGLGAGRGMQRGMRSTGRGMRCGMGRNTSNR